LENLESTIKMLVGPYFKQIMFMVLDQDILALIQAPVRANKFFVRRFVIEDESVYVV